MICAAKTPDHFQRTDVTGLRIWYYETCEELSFSRLWSSFWWWSHLHHALE